MNRALVDPIANAVLYEGYILYPYRPSIKNRQRWTFGGLFPEAYCDGRTGSDSSSQQTECLIQGTPVTMFEAVIRFLHLTNRIAGELEPRTQCQPGEEPAFRPAECLRVGSRIIPSWQEAEEREVAVAAVALGELCIRTRRFSFEFPGRRWLEPVSGDNGDVAGVLVRVQQAIVGVVEVAAREVAAGLFRVTFRVTNRTPLEAPITVEREDALLHALASTHAIFGVEGGAYVSLLDPPESCREAAAQCRNLGTWPVLVGAAGHRDMMLSSPIILYDYPQIAPESHGDFFDGTEIDEMLTLRVLTMTDEEKRTMAGVDERACAILARVEGMARHEMLGLHGTIRTLRPVAGGDVDG